MNIEQIKARHSAWGKWPVDKARAFLLKQANQIHQDRADLIEEVERVRGLQRHTVEKDVFSHCYVIVSCGVRNGEVVYADEINEGVTK